MSHVATRSVVVLAFIVALEIVVMISPFAFYFYAVFNPFLLALNHSPVTRWLTAFFLPHMIEPPNGILAAIRILGSVLFVLGGLVFIICAAQVYLGKVLKKGPAISGLYAVVRHPQYLGLALAALGLAIMWPRFLTLVLFGVMLYLYFLLARDEERRMQTRFGEGYRAYRSRTGMFLPRGIERYFVRKPDPRRRPGFLRSAIFFLGLLVLIVAVGFAAREYTVHHLPLRHIGSADVLTITVSDSANADALVPAVLEDSLVAGRLRMFPGGPNHRLLAYVIPIDYVMQGMIANTGDEWKLFEQHKTLGMITDYIFHPFAHLSGGHAMHMAGMQHDSTMYAAPEMKRRVIFVDISSEDRSLLSPSEDFGLNNMRAPLFFADVHLHTAEILQVSDVPPGSGWGTVPTPMF
jgi:protein-S-isoprenylcysteine O-methyltransferase Ste14